MNFRIFYDYIFRPSTSVVVVYFLFNPLNVKCVNYKKLEVENVTVSTYKI